MKLSLAVPVILLVAPLLAACASDSDRYPSLARRDVERVAGSAGTTEPAPALSAVPAPPPPGLADRLAGIAGAAREAHAEFLNRAPATRRRAAAASGAGVATDRWAEAQVALADLESARSDTMFALADLDSLLATNAVAAAESDTNQGLLQIAALREEVADIVAQEDATLEQIYAIFR